MDLFSQVTIELKRYTDLCAKEERLRLIEQALINAERNYHTTESIKTMFSIEEGENNGE